VQIVLFDVEATLSSSAQVVNGGFHASQRAQGSLRAPIPVAGPNARFYLLPNSSRLYVTGQLLGMYFFGYGNFLSTVDTLGFTLNRHFGVRAGYQLAQRFTVNNKSNRIGFDLTQGGPVVGLKFSLKIAMRDFRMCVVPFSNSVSSSNSGFPPRRPSFGNRHCT
jgi:hypothetical protein